MSDQARTQSKQAAHRPASRQGPLWLALALGALAFLLVAPTAQASRAVVGTFGAPNGEGKGRLDNPKGLAVNRSGAGGVGAGDVYVVDGGDSNAVYPGNNRVVEFSASGAFVRAFGYDVVASGPGNTGVDEKQTVSVDASGGTFTLRLTKRSFAGTTEGSNVVTNVGAPTSVFHVGDAVSAGGGFPAGTTIAAVGADSLTLSASAAETVPRVDFNATETTAPIPFDASAANLESALAALPAIGAGNVAVSGAASPFTVEFDGVLGHDDIAELSPNSSALTGLTHTATVATAINGGGYEVCESASDVCKAGSESAAAGGMSKPAGVAVDQANGNVYVTDANINPGFNNNRVNVYSAKGAFEGAFGWRVDATSPEERLQFCTAVTGCRRGTGGGGQGQLTNAGSLGSSPAVDPSNGHLYVPDGGNQRIDEFAPVLNPGKEVTGVSFVKAFGYDVVQSGPDDVTPVNETQLLTITATGGKFTLSFRGSTTPPLSSSVGASTLTNALRELSSVTLPGNPQNTAGSITAVNKGAGKWELVFGLQLEDENVPQITADGSQLLGGTATVSTLTEGVSPYERCDVATNPSDVCKAGLPGRHLGQFCEGDPASVSVDSTGAIYALSTNGVICQNGQVGIERVTKFDPAASSAEEFAPALLTKPAGDPQQAAVAIAVDPASDHLLVAKDEGLEAVKFLEFDGSGSLLETVPAGSAVLKGRSSGGLAVGPGGSFYFSNRHSGSPGVVDIFGPPPPPTVCCVTVSDVGATTATFHGTVTPPPPGPEGEHFATGYHFETSVDGVEWRPFPAEDVEVGDGSGAGSPGNCPVENPPSCDVEQAATGLQPGAEYQVRLVGSTGTAATSSPVAFTTEPAPPSISGMLAEEVGESGARISGLVNPNNEATGYHFEYGTDTGYGSRLPVEVEESAGSGGKAVKVSAELTGLQPGTLYHFRLVASNASGETKGPDWEFSTLDSSGLPDGRGYELVSPADKRPQGLVSTQFSMELTFQPASDGNSFLFPIYNGLLSSTVGGSVSYMARRGAGGWEPTQVSPPSLLPRPTPGTALSIGPAQVEYLSPDFSCGILESPDPLNAEVPAADVENGVFNLFRRNADGTYKLISSEVPDNPNAAFVAPFKENYLLAGASPDCERVYFKTAYHLLAGASGLYEWDHGTLRDAGLLPDGTVPNESEMGGQFKTPGGIIAATRLGSVSRDGSRFFFNAIGDEGKDKGKHAVFVRKDGGPSVDVSQPASAPVDLGARYETASPDGSHVFFAANYGLAAKSSSGPSEQCPNAESTGPGGNTSPCDIYDYDVETGQLTDISADANPADPKGAVALGIVAVSDDGSYAYFATKGQLIAGKGGTYAQNLGGGANVYLYHAGQLSYVASLGKDDIVLETSSATIGNAFSNLIREESIWTAQATPDGRHLLFTAKANVTGYQSGGAYELYRYSAQDAKTICVSCRPDGLPSLAGGAYIPMPAAPQKELHTARTISDDGRRVFFTTPDVLAPGAAAGNENVYEWEAGQVYLLASLQPIRGAKMLEASPSGDDVFIVGIERLAPQDTDSVADVYDVRAPHSPGEQIGFPVPKAPTPCDPLGEGCQGAAAPQPAPGAGPASQSFSGPGNVAPKKHHRHKRKRRHGKAHKKRSQGKRANANRGGAK